VDYEGFLAITKALTANEFQHIIRVSFVVIIRPCIHNKRMPNCPYPTMQSLTNFRLKVKLFFW